MPKLADDIGRAYAARESFRNDSDLETYRLFHGYSEGLPGLEIDCYGNTAILSSKRADAAQIEAAAEALREVAGFTLIVANERGQAPRALCGTMPEQAQTVIEEGLRYGIEPWAELNPGLYLDARAARQWLRTHSEGRRVLNLFAFAGSLGVAAMAGGAASITQVDSQKRALKRCLANHALNAQRVDARDLICEDVPKFLKRSSRGKRRYGGVILDPPPGREDGDQTGRLSPLGLAKATAALVETEGWILVFFHHDPRSWGVLEALFSKASERKLEAIWRGRSGSDFPEADETRALRLSAFRVF